MPALGARQPFNIGYRDQTGEIGHMTVYTGELTAVSLPGALADMGDLTAATDLITLGVRATEHWGEKTYVSNALPGNNAAQREQKLLVQYQGDTTEKPYILTIPTVDHSKLVFLPGAKDAVAFTAGTGAHADIIAWVTAFEALARTPDDDAETVTVTGMRFVGRNS